MEEEVRDRVERELKERVVMSKVMSKAIELVE
jgi:hypothetical protein